jgi:hypothetical protein
VGRPPVAAGAQGNGGERDGRGGRVAMWSVHG